MRKHTIQNDGTWKPIIDWLDSLSAGSVPFGYRPAITRNDDGTLNVETANGVLRANVGDWLVYTASGFTVATQAGQKEEGE